MYLNYVLVPNELDSNISQKGNSHEGDTKYSYTKGLVLCKVTSN